MDLGLTGRVAIVTGASRGIGFACAAELAAEGAHVVAISHDPVRNAAACEALMAQAKGRVMGAPVDLNDGVACTPCSPARWPSSAASTSWSIAPP